MTARFLIKYRLVTLILLLLLAVCAAVAGFMQSSYLASTLLLEARTMEAGVAGVSVLDRSGKERRVQFVVGNDQGEPSFYPIELPPVLPEAIHIAPLGSKGSFALDMISIQLDSVSYFFDAAGACTQKSLPGGVIKREPCRNGFPKLTINDDNSVAITQIPEDGFVRTLKARSLIALALFIAVIVSGAWLLRRLPEPRKNSLPAVYGGRIFWLALIAVYLLQMSAIWRYSVDLPFWEEWEYFLPEALPSGLTLEWLFSFAGIHLVVPTKLMAWLNYKLLGLDFTVQKLVNYLIYGCLLVVVVRLKRSVIGADPFWMFPGFLLFMLSPIAFENHSNSYQSQIHLLLVFALLALFYAYTELPGKRATVMFSICLLAALLTFSAGMTIAAVYLTLWTLYLILQIARKQIPLRQGAMLMGLNGVIVSVGAAIWIFGYRQPDEMTLIYPNSMLFWDSFLNLLSFGFGFEVEHQLPGIICLMAALIPVVMLLSNADARSNPRVWRVVTGILGLLAILATISITRGGFAGSAKLSRYAEFGLLLIPLVSMAWWLALENAILRRFVLGLLWCACFLAFLDDWSFAPYRHVRQMSYYVIENLEEYAAGRGDAVFTWTHKQPLEPFFIGAQKLDVKFTRQFHERPSL